MVKAAEFASQFNGEKLYQRRARIVLPVLVRQAQARQPIFYGDLARETDIPNPRNLDYPLGCIGYTLNELAKQWNAEIPHIQAIVKNQNSNLPGPGIDNFLKKSGYEWKNKQERKAVIEEYWTKIYVYPYWEDVLQELGVEPTPNALGDMLNRAGQGRGSGEGAEHLALKLRVCTHPYLVGLKSGDPEGETEYLLPSGDRIDVTFVHRRSIHAVEVKPIGAPVHEIARGLFQCVKYRAVLEARLAWERDRREITVRLALGGSFPAELIPLCNSLNITVFENLSIK